MRGNYGIYRIANYSYYGYDKILQSRQIKEKHRINFETVFFED